MNGVKKWKKSQHQNGKGSKGGGKLERPIMSLIISFPVISWVTQILTNMIWFKVELENRHRFSDLSSHTNSLLTALRSCQKNTSIIKAHFWTLARIFNSLTHFIVWAITGERVRLFHSLWRKHILLWSSTTWQCFWLKTGNPKPQSDVKLTQCIQKSTPSLFSNF